jgi:hypothetical protein
MSPAMVAAAAVAGEVTDPRRFFDTASRTVTAADVEEVAD